MANPIARTLGAALGKLFRNLRNPKWVAAETGKAGASILILNPVGKYVSAKLHGHYHHEGGKLGDHYKDSDGNEYIVVDGKKYRHNPNDDQFYVAD